MPSKGHPDPHELIPQALEHLSDDSDGYRNLVEFKLLSEQLVLSLRESNSPCPNLSVDRLQPEVEDILEEVSDDEGDIDDFYSAWEGFTDSVDDTDQIYSIILPLRVTKGVSSDFQIGDAKLERISESEWNEYTERAVVYEEAGKEEEREEKINEFENYADRFDDSSLFDPYENSYWRFECEASDLQYAAYRFSTILECVLGQINYAYLYGRELPLDTGELPGLSRRHQERGLHRPPCYLIFENRSYSQLFKNRKHHATRELKPAGSGDISDILSEVDLSEIASDETIGQSIIRGFRSVHAAITAQDLKGTFHAYWRALEALTLIEDGDPMSQVPTRLQASMENPVRGTPRPTTDRLKDKRNQLIHIGTDVRISTSDINLLKYLVESMMDYMIRVEERYRNEDYSIDEVRVIFDKATKPRDVLAEAVRSHLEHFAEEGGEKSGREHLRELRNIVAVYDWRWFNDEI